VLARNVVATSQPLAVQAGIAALERGGNAVDAALAAAITLVVVEPTNNGLGSDAFAIVSTADGLHAINGSGRAPAGVDVDRLTREKKMPLLGWDAVTVPGAVSCWVELSRRFGRLPFADLFERAIHYAHDGYAVSPVTARLWATVAPLYSDFAPFSEAFLPGGRAPHAGETFRIPALGASLAEVATTTGESFYGGRLAEAMAAHAAAEGAALRVDDLAGHTHEDVETLSVEHSDWRLHELPPNGQGIAALIALGILDHTPIAELDVDSADSFHLQIEAMKLAFADVHAHVGDPDGMFVAAGDLLDPDYLAVRAAAIDMRQAREHPVGNLARGDTVYLTTADADGMMVSFIQSNYFSFGSGIVVPGTGISLQNRGNGFSTHDGHPNRVAPGRRPFHTIIPAFVTRNGAPLMSFGVMGGAMQPQGHLQVLVRMADGGMNPQAALDAPRWQVIEALDVALEEGVPDAVAAELESRGHRVKRLGSEWFGGGQTVLRRGDGYVAASDPRKDGLAAGF
jgi:gamma-glutamyltranspeptidase/glutathione hydrolase